MRAEDLLNAWDQGLDQPLPVEQPKTPKTAEELLDDWDAENAGFLSGIKDIGASVVASLPATAQGIVDVGRMVTGDPVWMENLSEWVGNKTESLKNATLSDAALAQQRRIQRGLNDPAFKASDLHQLLSDNPLGALTMAGESVGTMVVPIGAGGAAARGVSWASQLAKAGRGGNVARIIGGVNPTVAATVGANTGNAALNAADTFTSHEMDGKPMSDRYTGAGVSGLVSLAAGKLTGGGAEGIVARRLAQDIGKNAANNAVARVLGQVAIGGAKEGLQEGIEESGNVLGEHVGASTPVDLNQDAKRVGLSAALGALIGGPVSGISAYSERGGNQPVAANTPTPTQTQAPAQTSEADANAAIDALSKLAQTLSNTEQVPAQAQTQVQSPAPTPISAPAPSQPPVQVASQTEAPEQIRIMPQAQNRATDTADRSPVLQNRDRDNKASIEQMQSIANNPDYGRVGVGREFANGAPIVAYGSIPENQKGRVDYAATHTGERIPIQYAVVEADTVATSHSDMGSANTNYGSTDRVTAIAGNGRIAGITAAYRRGTADTYRSEMMADSAMHGVDPQVISGMKNPVLVRIMPNERVTGNIGDISNTTGNQSLNAVEKAHNDANRIDFASLQFNEDGSPTQETIAGFIRSMPAAERAELIDSHGRANSQAIDRLSNAIFAKAYGNDDVIAMYAMAVDPDAKLVINTLSALAPKLYRLEGCGELDFREVLIQAANQIIEGKRKGLKIADIVKQVDAFSDPDIALFLDLFAQNPRSNKQVIEVLSDAADFAYNEATRDIETADMFGEVLPAGRADLMQHIRQTNDQITELRNAQRQAKRSQAANIQNSAGSVRSGQNAPRGNAGTNPSQNEPRGSSDAQGNEGFSLTGQTESEIEAEARAREEAEAQRTREEAQDQQRQEAQNLRNEVASLNDEYSDNFTLTDDSTSAEDALRGQENLRFSRNEERLAPNGKASNLTEFQWHQVRTPEFKAWFGDWENDPHSASKVLDENGEPRVVYHGTNNVQKTIRRNPRTGFNEYEYSNFESFETQYDEQPGHFFNSNRDNAGSYGSNIYDVYLNLKNPLIIDANNSGYDSIRYNGMVNDTYGWAQWAKDNGYDGVIFNNVRDGAGFAEMSEVTNNYVAFRSNQIKSATDNNGEFNPNDRRLKFSRSTKFKPEMELVDGIKQYFGTTWNAKEAGYMMQDGDMLNMSGTHEVEDERTKRSLRGHRSVDHREVSGTNIRGVSTEHFFEDQNIQDQSDYMYNFMARTGAMRMDYGSGVAALSRQPTRAQLQMLQRMAYENDGLIVSYYTPEGRIVDEAEWEGPVTQKKIKDFFVQAQQKADAGEAGAYASRANDNQGGSTVESIAQTLSNDSDIGEAFRNLRSRGSVVVIQSENELPGYSMASRSPMKSVDANIRRGKEAMAKALSDKTTVHRAMFRTGMGWVDFVWGDEGGTVRNDGRRPGEKGIAHIIEARMRKDNLSKPEVFNLLNRIVEAIAKGKEVYRKQVKSTARVNIEHNGVQASLVKNPASNTWLLTGFEVRDSGDSRVGYDSPSSTSNAPHLPGAGEVAESLPPRTGIERHTLATETVGLGERPSMGVNSSVEAGDLIVKRSANGAIQGAYDPREQKVYLVADNLNKDNARSVFFHEVGVHMAADEDMKPVFARAKQIVWNGAANGDKVAKAAKDRMDAAGETSPEEAAGYLVEEYIRAKNDLPESHPIVQWFKDLARRIRLWVNKKFGSDVPGFRLSTEDIVAVAKANAKSLGAVERKPSSGRTRFSDQYRGEWREKRSSDLHTEVGGQGTLARNFGLNSGWGAPIQRDQMGRWKFAWGEHVAIGLGNVALDVAEAAIPALRTKYAIRMAPKEVRQVYRELRAEVDNARRRIVDVAQEMSKWSDNDRRMISDFIEGTLASEAKPPEHVIRVASLMSELMTQQGEELVSLGMLSEEAFNRWRGQYLPRFYNRRQELKDEKWFKNFMRGARPIRGVAGGSLKGRGNFSTIEVGQLEAYLRDGWEVRDARYTLKKEAENAQPELQFKDMPEREIDPHETVEVWRDWTPQERFEMGEIRDAGYRFTMGYMQMQEDLALGRLFKRVAENPSWTRNTPSEGYTKVPEDIIPETGGVKKYGVLAGKYVKDEVLAQLMPQAEIKEGFIQAYRNALSYWKEGKTALNPVSHMNNTAGNVIMAHLAGVNMWDVKAYLETVRAIKNDAEWVKEAEENGLFTGSFSKEEIAKLLPEQYAELEKAQESRGKLAFEFIFDNLLNYGLRQKMRNLYEAEDTFFKALIYKKAIDGGMTPKDAVDYALGYIPTYDDLPGGARAIRDSVIPFFAWTYKIVPRLLYSAVAYPHRFVAPAMLMGAINMLSYAIAAGDDDNDWLTRIEKGRELMQAEEGLLPEYMQGTGAMFNPKFIRLWKDPTTNLPVFWNVSNFIPGGQLFDFTNQAGGVPRPEMLAVGSPLWTISAALGLNVDTFTGREVTKQSDTFAEASEKRMTYLWRQLAPALAVGGWHFERIANAAANYTGEPVLGYTGIGRSGQAVTPLSALVNTAGIKVRDVDFDKEFQYRISAINRENREIKTQIRSMARYMKYGAVTPEQGKKEIDYQTNKLIKNKERRDSLAKQNAERRRLTGGRNDRSIENLNY